VAGSRGDRLGHWANAKAEREFAELDTALRTEALASLHEHGWSAVLVESEVSTSYGATHVERLPGTGVPLVFLHGAGATSLMWFPLLDHLAGRSVVLVDVVGEPGHSLQRRAIHSADDLVAWLDEVLTGLALDRVDLLGASYGGWIALNYARQRPTRVRTLTMVEPVFDKVRPWFWAHGLLVLSAFAMPRSLARKTLHRLHMSADVLDDKRVRRYGALGLTKYRRGLPGVTPLTDEQLRATEVRTLLLLGEHSEVHKADAVAARARTTMPNVDAQVVSDAGHALSLDKPDDVAARLLAFLDT
jgi:pimeloyl-ACP methyl ester carboxylesterase